MLLKIKFTKHCLCFFETLLKRINISGELLLTNWRPILLSDICYDSDKTVSDIFNQLSSVPTLKIVIRYQSGLRFTKIFYQSLVLVGVHYLYDATRDGSALRCYPKGVVVAKQIYYVIQHLQKCIQRSVFQQLRKHRKHVTTNVNSYF